MKNIKIISRKLCWKNRIQHLLWIAVFLVFVHNVISLIYFKTSNIKWYKRRISPMHNSLESTEKSSTSACQRNYTMEAGPIAVDMKIQSEEDLNKQFSDVSFGGSWNPSNCTSYHKVAVLVPYRDRYKELMIFLHHIHSFLQRQNIQYTIILIEQTEHSFFNRGLLLNVGFTECGADSYDCVVIHDVDMLPEDDRILYNCLSPGPRHMCLTRSKRKYRRVYNGYLGGIVAYTPHHYRKINGFSNIYFGWGTEDNDLFIRTKSENLSIYRYPIQFSRCFDIPHKQQTIGRNRSPVESNENKQFIYPGKCCTGYDLGHLNSKVVTIKGILTICRVKYLNLAADRYKKDGLNDMSNLNYTIITREEHQLYTKITVDVNSTQVVKHILQKVTKKET